MNPPVPDLACCFIFKTTPAIAWIKSCDLGQLSYDSDELLNISLTMRYDYFKIGSSAKLPNASISSMFRA